MTMILLGLAGYFVAALVSTALLIRLRPEWMLVVVENPERKVDDWFAWLSKEDRKVWSQWTSYETLHHHERELMRELVEHRRKAAMDNPTPAIQYGPLKDEVVAIVAPFALVLGLPASMVIRAATRSVNAKTKTRTELEKELAAARKEVDELMRRGEV